MYKIEDFIDTHFSKILLFVVFITILFTFYLFFLHDSLQLININGYDKVGLAQVSLEAASVFALILAALEFRKSQRKPVLNLVFSQTEDPLNELKEIVIPASHSPHAFGSESYFLLLMNSGYAPARWIKIQLEFINPYNDVEMRISHHLGKWDTTGKKYTFQGGDDFIVYNPPKGEKILLSELDTVGKISFDFFAKDKKPILPGKVFQIKYSIQADGFQDFNKKINILLT